MAEKPVDLSQKYMSSEALARLPRAEQQRRLGGQPSGQPFGVADQPGAAAPPQRTKSPQEMAQAFTGGPERPPDPAPQQASGRRQQVSPAPQQRTLTPEEKQRRLEAFQRAASQQGPVPPFEQVMAQDDPAWTPQHVGQGVRQPDGGPHEGFERRMQRVLATPHPHSVDLDRDGHPDLGAGRSARDIQNWHSRMDRGAMVRAAVPQQVDRDRDGYPDAAVPGVDGYRQDQIGYRQRLRARRAVFNEGPGAEAEEAPLPVSDRPFPGDHTPDRLGRPGQEASAADLTPPAQAALAPAGPRTAADARAVQVSNAGPARPDAQGQPAQATLGDRGEALVVSDPQGHTPPRATPNNPVPGDIQTTLPPGQPNPVGPAATGGPAQPPLAHAATPTPEAAKASPAATSPPAAPAQQNIPGQQHPTAQQAPPQQPQSRFAAGTPQPPAANAPAPADAPERGKEQGKPGA